MRVEEHEKKQDRDRQRRYYRVHARLEGLARVTGEVIFEMVGPPGLDNNPNEADDYVIDYMCEHDIFPGIEIDEVIEWDWDDISVMPIEEPVEEIEE